MRSSFAGPGQSTGKYKPKLDPGKSMPSNASGSPGDFYSKSQKDVIDEVPKGTKLKHADTTDKSKPAIPADVHVKKVDRKPFLAEVGKDHELHHVDNTADRSEPRWTLTKEEIDADVHIKANDHDAFLQSVEAAAKDRDQLKDEDIYE